jgi:hypothetical protein
MTTTGGEYYRSYPAGVAVPMAPGITFEQALADPDGTNNGAFRHPSGEFNGSVGGGAAWFGPTFKFTTGDGGTPPTGGEVGIDTAPIGGDGSPVGEVKTRAVYQRNFNGTPVFVPLVINNGGTSLEYSVFNRDTGTTGNWSSFDSESGGVSRKTVSLTAGWFDFIIRNKSTGAQTQRIEKVGVGDVFVVAGQSNSENFGGTNPSQVVNERVSAYNLSSGEWVLGSDPQTNKGAYNLSGASPWSYFGNYFTQCTNVPIHVISVGWGNTRVEQWTPSHNGTPPGNEQGLVSTSLYVDRLQPAINQVRNYNGARAVFWHQGENDTSRGTSTQSYQAWLNSIISQSRLDVGDSTLPWFVALVSEISGEPESKRQPVLDGQINTIIAGNNVTVGSQTDKFLKLPALISDGIHFSSIGVDEHAKEWFNALKRSGLIAELNGCANLEKGYTIPNSGLLQDANSDGFNDRLEAFFTDPTDPVDTTPPVITFAPSVESVQVNLGEAVSYPVVSCSDDLDGDRPVTDTGTVSTGVAGEYARIYSCADSASNPAQKAFTVTVVDDNPNGGPLTGQLGVLNLSANGGINPVTGSVWQAGDQYRLAFVTSQGTQATSTNIASYNAFVDGLADDAGYNGIDWRVIGSTNLVAARDNTLTDPAVYGTGVAIFAMDGTTKIVDNYSDLWDGSLDAHISFDENGNSKTGGVFGGSENNGTQRGSGRVLGGSTESPPKVTIGNTTAPLHRWMVQFNALTTSTLPVYALSEVLTIGVTSPLDEISPIVTLVPASLDIRIPLNGSFSEPTVTCIDDVDGVLPVSISNPVDPTQVGTYNPVYSCQDQAGNHASSDSEAIKVEVFDDVDSTSPIIELDTPVLELTILRGSRFIDYGVSCTDDQRDPPTLTISGSVNVNVIDVYSIIYTCTDDEGNQDIETLTVNVVETLTGDPLTPTNGRLFFQSTLRSPGQATGSNRLNDGDRNTSYTLTLDDVSAAPIWVGDLGQSYDIDDLNLIRPAGGSLFTVERYTIYVSDQNLTSNGLTESELEANSNYIERHEADQVSISGSLNGRFVYWLLRSPTTDNSMALAEIEVYYDTTQPTLQLTPAGDVTLIQGSPFIEPNQVCTDDKGTTTINTSGSVDSDTVGVYKIVYRCDDGFDNVDFASITVTVIPDPNENPDIYLVSYSDEATLSGITSRFGNFSDSFHCPTDKVIVDMAVGTSSSLSDPTDFEVFGVSFACATLNHDGSLTDIVEQNQIIDASYPFMFGDEGQGIFSLPCTGVITGLRGNGNFSIERLGHHCSGIAQLADQVSDDNQGMPVPTNGSTSNPFSQRCEAGQVATGAQIYVDPGSVDQLENLQLICAGILKIPANDDLDDDGEPNSIDNCPAISNALQLDSDQDGVGDACDSDSGLGRQLSEAHHTDPVCDLFDDDTSQDICFVNVAYRKLLLSASSLSASQSQRNLWGNNGLWDDRESLAVETQSYALIQSGTGWEVDLGKNYELTGFHIALAKTTPSTDVAVALFDENDRQVYFENLSVDLVDGYGVVDFSDVLTADRTVRYAVVGGNSSTVYLSEFEALVSDPFVHCRNASRVCDESQSTLSTLSSLIDAVEKFWGGDIELLGAITSLSANDIDISGITLNQANINGIDIDFTMSMGASNAQANVSTIETTDGYDLLLIFDMPAGFSSTYSGQQISDAISGMGIVIPLGQARQNVASEGDPIYEGVSSPSFNMANLTTGARARLNISAYVDSNANIDLESGINFISTWRASWVTGSSDPVVLYGGIGDNSLSTGLEFLSNLTTDFFYLGAKIPFNSATASYLDVNNTLASVYWRYAGSAATLGFGFDWDQAIFNGSGNPIQMQANLFSKLPGTSQLTSVNPRLSTSLREPWQNPFGISSLEVSSMSSEFDFDGSGKINAFSAGARVQASDSDSSNTYSAVFAGEYPNGLKGDEGHISVDLSHIIDSATQPLDAAQFGDRIEDITGTDIELPDFIANVSEWGFSISYSYTAASSQTSFLAYGNSEVCSMPTSDGDQLVTFTAYPSSGNCLSGSTRTELAFSVGGNISGGSLNGVFFKASGDYQTAARSVLLDDALNIINAEPSFAVDHARVSVEGNLPVITDPNSWSLNATVEGEWSKLSSGTNQTVGFKLDFGLTSDSAGVTRDGYLKGRFWYGSDIASCNGLAGILDDYQSNAGNSDLKSDINCATDAGFPQGVTLKQAVFEMAIARESSVFKWNLSLLGQVEYNTSDASDELRIDTASRIIEGVIDISSEGLIAGFLYEATLSSLAPSSGSGDGEVIDEFESYLANWMVIAATYDITDSTSETLQQFYDDANLKNPSALGLNGAGIVLLGHSTVPESIVKRLHFLGLRGNLTTDLKLVYDNTNGRLSMEMDLETRNCEARLNLGLPGCELFSTAPKDDSTDNQYPHWFNSAKLKVAAKVDFSSSIVDLGIGGRLNIQLSEDIDDDDTDSNMTDVENITDEILNFDITSDIKLNVAELTKSSILLCGRVSSQALNSADYEQLVIATSIADCSAAAPGGEYFDMLNINKAQFKDLSMAVEITSRKVEVHASGSIQIERGENDSLQVMEYVRSAGELGFSVLTADPLVPQGVDLALASTAILSKDGLFRMYDHHRGRDVDTTSDPYSSYPDFAVTPLCPPGAPNSSTDMKIKVSTGNISTGNKFTLAAGFAYKKNGRDGDSITAGNFCDTGTYLGDINMHFDIHELYIHGAIYPNSIFDSNWFDDSSKEEFTFILNNQGFVAEAAVALPSLSFPSCRISSSGDCHYVANGSFKWQADSSNRRWFGTGPKVKVSIGKELNMSVSGLPSNLEVERLQGSLEWDNVDDVPRLTDLVELPRVADLVSSNLFRSYYTQPYVDSYVDFDGDGVTDLLQQKVNANEKGQDDLLFIRTPDCFNSVDQLEPCGVESGNNSYDPLLVQAIQAGSNTPTLVIDGFNEMEAIQYGDLNGDGSSDVLVASAAQLGAGQYTVLFGDLLTADTSFQSIDYDNLSSSLFDRVNTARIDQVRVLNVMPNAGDEIVVVAASRLLVCTDNVRDENSDDSEVCTDVGAVNAADQIYGIDIDGDGQKSIVVSQGSESTVYHYDDADTSDRSDDTWVSEAFISPIPTSTTTIGKVVVGDFDFNVDGIRSDEILYFDRGAEVPGDICGATGSGTVECKTWNWNLAKCTSIGSNGNCAAWTTEVLRENSLIHPYKFRFGDYDGDGEIDVMTTDYGSTEDEDFRVSYSAKSAFDPVLLNVNKTSDYFLPSSGSTRSRQ